MDRRDFTEAVRKVRDCKESSAMKYASTLDNIAKTFGQTNYEELPKYHDEIIKYIETKKNHRTCKNYYNAYLALLQLLYDEMDEGDELEDEVKLLMLDHQAKTDLEKFGNKKTASDRDWETL